MVYNRAKINKYKFQQSKQGESNTKKRQGTERFDFL